MWFSCRINAPPRRLLLPRWQLLLSCYALLLLPVAVAKAPLPDETKTCIGPTLDYSRVESVTSSSQLRKGRTHQVREAFLVGKASCSQRLRLREKQNEVPIFGAEMLVTVPGCEQSEEATKSQVEKKNGLQGLSNADVSGKTFSQVSVEKGYRPAVSMDRVIDFLKEQYHLPVDHSIQLPELFIFPSVEGDYLVYATKLLVPENEENPFTKILQVFVNAHELTFLSACLISDSPEASSRQRQESHDTYYPTYYDTYYPTYIYTTAPTTGECGTCDISYQELSDISAEITLQQVKSLYMDDNGKFAQVQEATVEADGSTINVPAEVDSLFWQGTYSCASSSYGCYRVELSTSCTDPASDVQYVAVETLKFTQSQLNVLGGLSMSSSNPQPVKAYAHYGYSECNAYYSNNEIYFGDCDCSFWSPLTTIDIVAHELAHGLTEKSSGLYYYDQSGGLNEGYSDILGAILEFWLNDAFDRPDFLVGETLLGSGGTLRFMEDPPLDGVSIGSLCDYRSGMGVHFSSGVLNKAFVKSVRACQASSCSRTERECALLMGKLFFYTNLSQLTSLSTFMDAAEKTCSVVEEYFTQLEPAARCTPAQVKSFAIEGWAAVDITLDEEDCAAVNSCPPNSFPTPAPTIDVSEGCLNATRLRIPSTESGTTVGAPNYVLGTCYGYGSSPGLWYEIRGNGETVEASLCTSTAYDDSMLSVLTGDCFSLECVAQNDDYCGYYSRVTFETNFGQSYWIFVHGYSGSTLSQFELTLSSVATTARPTWAPTPGPLDQEDGCLDAAPLPMPSSVIDSTSGANIYTVDTCGSAYGYSSSGLWYSVVGTGEFITASLCENSYFDTQLSVWTGSCADLECVAGSDDSCSYLSTVSWASTAGQNYFIYVHGYYGSSGSFQLDISPPTPTPTGAPTAAPVDPEDGCLAAAPLSIPSTTLDFTNDADVYAAESCADANSFTSAGLWYTVTGNGDEITASLCNSYFYTVISVWTGSCGDLQCVSGDDRGCGFTGQSSVSWPSNFGQQYWIFVYGSYGATGPFELSITTLGCFGCTPYPTPPPYSSSPMPTTVTYTGMPTNAETIVPVTPWPTPGEGETPWPTPGEGETPWPTPGEGSTSVPTPGEGETPSPSPGVGSTPVPTCTPGEGETPWPTYSDGETLFPTNTPTNAETAPGLRQGFSQFGPDNLETDSSIKTTRLNSQLTFSYKEGKGMRPSKEDIERLVEESAVFFKRTFKASAISETFSGLKLTETVPVYDAAPQAADTFILKFVAEIGVDDKATVTPREVAEIMANGDYVDYIDNYVRPVGSGAFVEARTVQFRGTGHGSFN